MDRDVSGSPWSLVNPDRDGSPDSPIGINHCAASSTQSGQIHFSHVSRIYVQIVVVARKSGSSYQASGFIAKWFYPQADLSPMAKKFSSRK